MNNFIKQAAVLLCILFASSLSAQTIERRVINTTGGLLAPIGGPQLHHNVGETFSSTLSGGGYMLTQGFIQPLVASVPPITGTLSVCAGSTTPLSNTASGGTWSSTNTAVATVGTTGIVSGLVAGTSTISYTVSGSAVTAIVTVNSLPVVSVITGNTTLSTAITTTLSNATGGGSWSSSASGVATVNSSGVVTGVAAGTAIISYTVSVSGCSTTVTTMITVNTPNTSLNLDGTNDYVNIGSVLTANQSYTKEAWVYANASAIPSNNIISGGSHPLWLSFGRLRTQQGASITDPEVFPLGQWVHVAATYDAATTTLKLYKNGILVASTASAATYPAETIYIGEYPPVLGNAFNGNIDEVRIWNVARAQAEIKANMNCNIAQNANLIAYYRFDNGIANGTNTGLTKAIDYSGNNNCGTLNNFNLTGTTSNYVPGAVGNCNTIDVTPASITGSSSVCETNTITLSNTNPGGIWQSSNTSVATVNTSGVVLGVSSGTVAISYTYLCTTVTQTITVNPLPNAGTISGTANVCLGGETTLSTSSTMTGSWSSTNTAVGTVAALTGAFTGISVGTTTISYTVTNGCGTNASTIVATVNPLPVAGTITGVSTVIVGGNTTLSNTITGGSWSSSSPEIATVGSTGIVSGVAAGTVVISYTVTNSCGSATATYNVTVFNAVDAGALSFDGINDQVSIGAPISTGSSYTKEAWVYVKSTSGAQNFISSFNAPLWMSLGVLRAGHAGSYSLVSDVTTMPINTWVHVAVTYDATSNTMKLYKNGVLISTATSVPSYTTEATFLGSHTGVLSMLYGAMDEVRIWNRALCADEIVNNMNCETGLPQTGLRAYYRFNQGIVAGDNTAINTLTDLSGNSFTGTLNNFTLTGASSNWIAGHITGACSSFSPVTAGTITGTATVCVGATTNLSSSGTSGGVWSSTNAAVGTISTSGVVTGIAAGTTTISYNVSNDCGTSSATKTITVNPLPDAGTLSGSGSTSMCIGGTNTVSSSGTPGGSWSSSNTAVGSVDASTGVITGIAVGTTIISYSVTNGCGTDVASRSFTVNPLPNAGTITGASVVNDGASITLANTTSGGTWSSSDPDIATVGSTGVVTGVSAGTVTISYTVTNICGSASATKTITVNAVLETGITGTLTVCVESTTTLSNATSGGSWSSSNTARATVNTEGVVTGVSAGTTVISYTLSGTSVTSIVTVNALPVAGTLSGAATICLGSTGTVSKTGTGGEWSSSLTEVATIGTTGIVSALTPGTTTISYTVTNGCGTVAATRVVTVIALPDAGTISGASSVCRTTITTLTSTVAGGTWSSSYATGASVNTSTGLVTGLAAGSFTISYRMTSSCGTSTATFPITVLNAPAPGAVSGTATVCASATTTLTNTTSGGTWSSTNTSAATIADATTGVVTGVGAGTSTISYTVTNICGSATVTRVVTVNALPVAAVITGTATVSVGTTTTLTATPAAGTWLSGSGTIASVNASGIVTGVSAGIATISYNRSNTCGIATATVAVTVSAATTPITGTRVVCEGATTNLANATAGGTWSTANASIAAIGTTGILSGVATGTTTVTYTFSSGGNVTATVTVNAAPAAYTGSGILCVGSQLNLGSIIPGCTWTSGTKARATVVSATGVVTGVAVGTVNISYVNTSGC
eukprot:gene21303-27600_t